MEDLLSQEELECVRHLESKRHFQLCFFPLLWIGGATLSLNSANQYKGIGSSCFWILGIVASGIALNASFLVMHEGTHFLLSSNRMLNRWFGFLTGLPIFLSFTAYQVLHIRHHDYLGDPRDPDDYDNYTGHPAKVWMLHWLRLLFAGYLYLIFVPILAWKHGNKTHRQIMGIEYLLLTAFYTFLFTAFPFRTLAHVWLLPTFIANILVNSRGLTQHSLALATDPFLASRSIRTRPWVAFLYLNENYHLEHHLFPSVPFYNLPLLQTILAPRLPRALVVPSYTWFVWQFMKTSLHPRKGPIGHIVEKKKASD